MTEKKRLRVPRSEARVLLSEVLPYEAPPAFSNRGFFHFANDVNLRFEADNCVWNATRPGADAAVKLILGLPQGEIPSIPAEGRHSIPFDRGEYTIPYKFAITRRDGKKRDLAVIHPRNQLASASFFAKHANSILAHTGASKISIRFPAKVTSYTYENDQLHRDLVATWSGVEVASREHEMLRSYFSYEAYNNVYKFYESTDYQRLEKRYARLMRLDISKCFASIYTHSIAWAVYGKSHVKEYLRPATMKRNLRRPSFPEEFDQLMQRMNYNETNGIVVGSELARIFAEIILQRVDKELLRSLITSDLDEGKDFEIRRYVDDYFVFFDDPADGPKLKLALEAQLTKFNLHLNESKEIGTSNPDVSPLTMAKLRIKRLFKKRIVVEALPDLGSITNARNRTAQTLVTDYKTVIKETGVDAGDVLNFSLSQIERQVVKLLRTFAADPTTYDRDQLGRALRSVVELVFFLYSASPLVNPTAKALRIVNSIHRFTMNYSLPRHLRAMVSDAIYLEIIEHLNKAKTLADVQVESLYLLMGLRELGRTYLLSDQQFSELFSISANEDGELVHSGELDHFAITTLLHYMGHRTRYVPLKNALVDYASKRIDSLQDNHAERSLLVLDLACCPYISEKARLKILFSAGIESRKSRLDLIALRSHWFTKWSNFNLADELEFKRSQEVY